MTAKEKEDKATDEQRERVKKISAELTEIAKMHDITIIFAGTHEDGNANFSGYIGMASIQILKSLQKAFEMARKSLQKELNDMFKGYGG